MKRCLLISLLSLWFAPVLMAQSNAVSGDHAEVGVFADYLRFGQTSPHINFVGLGGRAGFNVSSHVQIEAEMSYNFKRDFSSTFSNGVSTELVTTHLRTLDALFGPKIQTNTGPVRLYGTFKAGLINFGSTNQNATQGFVSQVGAITNGDTRAAIYPGGGVEGFIGPIGLRLEAGDEIYFDHGSHNNLRVTFGPQFRF